MLLSILLIFATTLFAAKHRFTLVIDAGHGGHDTGAMGAKSKESNINLNVALKFGKYVENNMPEVKVIYTRKTDVFIPLQKRANIANKNNADLFISVHTNALPGGKIARGFESYTLGMHRAKDNLDVAMRENSVISKEQGYKETYKGFDPNSSESYIMFEFIQGKNMEKSVELAREIQNRVCADADRPNKGVHQAGFLVLRETSMPSCLLELGFITTPDEEELLNNEERLDKIAEAIYTGFRRYKEKYADGITVPYRSEPEPKKELPQIVPDKYKKKKEQSVISRDIEVLPSAPKNDNKAEVKNETVKVAKIEPVKVEKREPVKVEKKESAKKVEVKQPVKTEKKEPVKEVKKEATKVAKNTVPVPEVKQVPVDTIVFKVQILANQQKLDKSDKRLMGETEYDAYKENGLYKYTLGSTSDYNEITRLRKKLLEKFPGAFIIAFKNGKKTDVVQAIREYKKHRNK